jgi:hypothetical protein
MKQRTLILITVIAAGSLSARATTLYVDPPSETVHLGVDFTVNIDLTSTNTSIYGFDMAILYSPTIMSIVSVNEQGFFGANGSGLNPDTIDSPDIITSLFDSASTPDNLVNPGPDVLFSITFLPFAVGSGSIQIFCDGPNDCADFPMLADASFNSIPVDATGLSVLTSSTPEPSFAGLVGAFLVLILCWNRWRISGQIADHTHAIETFGVAPEQ